MARKLAFVALSLLMSGAAGAEGGCPPGQTPAQFGANMGCVPGGNDSVDEYSQQLPIPPRQETGWWEKTWGAIASSETGGALGTALGASTRQEAEQAAFADCKTKGGGGCKVELAYRNQCAVMVIGNKSFRMYSAGSVAEATDYGMKDCQLVQSECRVYYSACTKPVFHRD